MPSEVYFILALLNLVGIAYSLGEVLLYIFFGRNSGD